MNEMLRELRPVARKDHDCMASEFLINGDCLRSFTFTFSEWRSVIKARDNGWKIKKGDRYVRQIMVDDGYLYTFKAIPEIHAICLKYEFYPLEY